MLQVSPIKDADARAAILRGVPEAGADAQILLLTEADKQLGLVAVDIKSSVLRMLAMELGGADPADRLSPEDAFLADFLMRAAASYGANHGAYRISSHIPAIEPILRPLGFTGENGIVTIDLIHIVHVTG